MKHTHDQHSGQLTLFQVAPTPTIKTIHDPYWDEVEEIAPEQPTQPSLVAVGSRVKISLEWMDKCALAVDKRYHKYYQHKSNHPLICKVIEVHDSGGNYIARGPNRFLYVPDRYFEIAPQHNTHKKESDDAPLTASPCNCVGAQVKNDTKKVAPQHDTHWVEKYWVERSGNKYWYYRYCWVVGRKKNRIYLGSANSAHTQNRKSEIELAINDGQSPQEIEQLIRQQRCV